MDEIRQLVYTSTARLPMLPVDLEEILRTSRANNLVSGITGMLLYRPGHFLQVLEGPKDQLSVLLDKLNKDPRHTSVRILSDRNVAATVFGAWSMAFHDLSGVELAASTPGYSKFLEDGFGSVECVRYPDKILRLLLAFREADLKELAAPTA